MLAFGLSSATVDEVVLGAELPLMMLLYLAVMFYCCCCYVGHRPASVNAVLWTQMCHCSGCRIGTWLPVVMLLYGHRAASVDAAVWPQS